MIQGEERMKATIVDVAKESGVSVATVSRVVNGNYPVREKTRLKVENAIKKLEYVPNLQARELNTQRSSSIGVVVPSFDNMFFVEVLDGIEEHLRQSSYSLLLACAQNDAAREGRALAGGRVGGHGSVCKPNPVGLRIARGKAAEGDLYTAR